MVCCFKKKH
jgi:hypothetical protein